MGKYLTDHSEMGLWNKEQFNCLTITGNNNIQHLYNKINALDYLTEVYDNPLR